MPCGYHVKGKGRGSRPDFMGTSEKVARQRFGVKNCNANGGCYRWESFHVLL